MLTRYLWVCAGLLATGTGIVGMVLPLLPTTPFLLLAALAFSRGSHSMHAWLLEHKTLGCMINDWRDYGAISRRAKGSAALILLAGCLYSLWLDVPGWLLMIQVVVLLAVLVFLLSRPVTAEEHPAHSRSVLLSSRAESFDGLT